jgi:hypothetical protein
VVLEPSVEALQQQRRRSRRVDLLVDRVVLARHDPVGQPFQFPVQDQSAAELEDVGPLANQAGGVEHALLAAPRVEDDLDAGTVAGLQRPHRVERELAVGALEQ